MTREIINNEDRGVSLKSVKHILYEVCLHYGNKEIFGKLLERVDELRDWEEYQALEQEPTKREIEREYLFQSLCEDFKKLQAENDDLRKRLEQEPKWIPVSERLPEEKDYCLCCDKDGYMTIGYILKWSKEWCFDDDEIDIDVVAWMPLPHKFEPQGRSEQNE